MALLPPGTARAAVELILPAGGAPAQGPGGGRS
jgi:hypothetical protein